MASTARYTLQKIHLPLTKPVWDRRIYLCRFRTKQLAKTLATILYIVLNREIGRKLVSSDWSPDFGTNVILLVFSCFGKQPCRRTSFTSAIISLPTSNQYCWKNFEGIISKSGAFSLGKLFTTFSTSSKVMSFSNCLLCTRVISLGTLIKQSLQAASFASTTSSCEYNCR
jgi:hypothetical protein